MSSRRSTTSKPMPFAEAPFQLEPPGCIADQDMDTEPGMPDLDAFGHFETFAETRVKPLAVAKAQSKRLIKTPVPWNDSDPALELGSEQSFFGVNQMHPKDLVHISVFGATGCGKSKSVVEPFLSGALKYELNNGKKACVFALDPKREFESAVRSQLSAAGQLDRLVVIGECPPIRLFPVSCNLSAADRMDLLMEFAEGEDDPKHSYWRQQAKSVLSDFLTLEMDYYAVTGCRLLNSVAEICNVPGVQGYSFWHGLRSVLAHSCGSSKKLATVNHHLKRIARAIGIESPSLNVMENFTATEGLTEQWSYTCMSMQPLLTALSNPDICAYVDMDIIANTDQPRTEIGDLIDQSKVILFCPEPSLGHAFAAKAIKQRLYEAVFSRADLEKPIFVALDEYQHFVTENDTKLLDRCRAYRCVVLLATQSVSSLKHALGGNSKAQNVTDIICINTPTRFSMRCNDADTAAWLRTQIPLAPDGGPHILDVRRLANLKPGEAYFMYANGDWGLKQARLTQAL